MCGIAGILNLQGSSPILPDWIHNMIRSLAHRGPDETGFFVDEQIGFGHARLNIIDLLTGSQPIHNEDKSLWITYNGEIFNYLTLKEDLSKRSHRFYTSSDTEVIIHAYEEWGEDCVLKMNGQFAFAIWDTKQRILFLARDRVGIRPLHYTVHQNRFLFASEIKALFTIPEIPRQIDSLAIDQIFTLWSTLPGRTIFKNIHSLPPGHTLTITQGEIRMRQYWDPPFSPPEDHILCSLASICEEVHSLLSDAIRIRLQADVSVGMYVSGGLDSSGIAAIVTQQLGCNLKTFGIGFESIAYDETAAQQEMVAYLQTKHSSIYVQDQDISKHLSQVLWHCETPLLRTAPTPLYLLSRTVRDSGVKVVLTGEGADEVFGGYNIFRETKARRFLAKNPSAHYRSLPISKLYPYILNNSKLSDYSVDFFSYNLAAVNDPLYSHAVRWHNTLAIKKFFSKDLCRDIGSYHVFDEIQEQIPPSFHSWDYLAKAQYLEMKIFMSQYLLSSQGDRVAMAHSIETRMPYLDYRLIEFLGRVPSQWKILGMEEKFILRKTLCNIVPDSVCRRNKFPFRAPTPSNEMLNPNHPLRSLLEEEKLKEFNIFDSTKVQLFLQRIHIKQIMTERDKMALIGLLSTQVICEQFLKRNCPF